MCLTAQGAVVTPNALCRRQGILSIDNLKLIFAQLGSQSLCKQLLAREPFPEREARTSDARLPQKVGGII